jgi:pantoate--beta-alanine ligase
MGCLHEGHLSLVRIGRDAADILVASIFVNPAQFGPNEDYDTYPRSLEKDLSLLEKEGVDLVFTPQTDQLYPDGYETYISLKKLPDHLCGLSRPVFFTGVATIVFKLFQIVRPHVAVFGQKDYQQLLVIRRMVQDLDLEIEIVGGPIIRESDGLAMSSRNNYLTPQQRPAALSLSKSLTMAQQKVADGIRDPNNILEEARTLILGYPDTKIDYLSICDPNTLDTVENIEGPVLMALAVKVGTTRLIDNMVLDPDR